MRLDVLVNGAEFHYYDGGGSVHAPDGSVIGTLDEQELGLFQDDSDSERQRSYDLLSGRVRAMAMAWLASGGKA